MTLESQTEDVKNLSISALLGNLMSTAKGEERKKVVGLLGAAERFGVGDMKSR